MIATLTKRLLEKLSRKPYRDGYVSEHVRTGISYQVRALREQRGWNQGKFAEELGKPQSVVSRLEDPDYGKLTLKTLLEVAETCDVALVVKYVSYPEFLRQYEDVSPEALQAESFGDSKFAIKEAAGVSAPIEAEKPEITTITYLDDNLWNIAGNTVMVCAPLNYPTSSAVANPQVGSELFAGLALSGYGNEVINAGVVISGHEFRPQNIRMRIRNAPSEVARLRRELDQMRRERDDALLKVGQLQAIVSQGANASEETNDIGPMPPAFMLPNPNAYRS